MITDFQNKKVTVMGLGLYEKGTGIEAVKFFLRQGAIITVTDLRSAKELETSVQELVRYYGRLPRVHNPPHPSLTLREGDRSKPPLKIRGGAGGVMRLTFILGRHREEDFKKADVIFQNPSVPADSPYLKIAQKRGIPIVNDWSLFLMRHTPKMFIGITGTRGKSTTTALIYEMLKKEYPHPSPLPKGEGDRIKFLSLRERVAPPWAGVRGKVWLAGNLGVSPLSFIDTYKGEPIVAELSSWLLHHFPQAKKSPNIAVVTNIMNDHLDKYPSMKEYIADKENIFKYQKRGDVLVLNYDNDVTLKMAKRAPGKVLWFSFKKHVPKWVPLEKVFLQGEHNHANALAAATVAEAAGVSRVHIMDVLKTFKGLPNRLQLTRTLRGVKYYNDTTATTPDATIAALKTLVNPHPNPSPLGRGKGEGEKRIVLIAGGADKKLEYKELAKHVKQYCRAVILLKGTATPKIQSALHTTSYILPTYAVSTMKEAVKKANTIAKDGDTILLSPAAASFGLFKNEFDRGAQFVDAVKRL